MKSALTLCKHANQQVQSQPKTRVSTPSTTDSDKKMQNIQRTEWRCTDAGWSCLEICQGWRIKPRQMELEPGNRLRTDLSSPLNPVGGTQQVQHCVQTCRLQVLSRKMPKSSSDQVIRVISKKPACRAGGDPTQDVKLTETTASPWPLLSFPSFLYVRTDPCFFFLHSVL